MSAAGPSSPPARLDRFGRMGAAISRRHRLVLGVWVLLVAALGLYGHDIADELTAELSLIEGTAAKRAYDISLREFGGADAMVVLLSGPREDLRRQGPALARRLGGVPGAQVISPWAEGAIEGLRPGPRRAALLVRLQRRKGEDLTELLPPVRAQIAAVVERPVRASVAGLPSILESYRRAADNATLTGELIAVPVVLIVLLFVFRSVFAALMPLVVGGAVVLATRGVLSLLNQVVTIDLFALGVVGMIGLALGVDYSLLVVSRFREEQRRRGIGDAVAGTVSAGARSIVPAGSGLVLAMLFTVMLLPGAIARSVAIAVVCATVLSVISALCVVPALLTALGANLDRWAMSRREGAQIASLRWSRRLTARPRAVASIVLAMLICSALAFNLDSGVATVELLPAGDTGRQEQEDVERALGPGWTAPMEVVVKSSDAPVTSPQRLRSLARFQRRIERDPGVAAVAGVAPIARRARQLSGVQDDLAEQERGLDRLETGLARAHDGAALNTGGLLKAAAGSRRLDLGLGAADDGAGLLVEALQAAGSGSNRLAGGLGRADEGSGELAAGAAKASSGARRLASGLERAGESTDQILASADLFGNAMRRGNDELAALEAPVASAEQQLTAAWQALQEMTTGRADPQYAAALNAVEEAARQLGGTAAGSGEQADTSNDGVEAGIERAQGQFDVGLYLTARLRKSGDEAKEGVAKLARGSEKLDRGLRRLAAGSRQLASGIEQLARGGERLPPALIRLTQGASRLQDGLARLGAGSGLLADGLGAGAQRSKLLSGGLDRIGTALSRGRRGDSELEQVRAQSPDLFRSGYFVLAGLDGTSPERRDRLGFLVNLDRGGLAARMLVVPRHESSSVAAVETKQRLEGGAAVLARQTGAEVLVGGVTPNEIEVNEAVREQVPMLRLALALVTFLVLLPVVRSLTLSIVAALLNLLTVSATFGLLTLFFNTSLLGGPGYVDATVIPATVILLFGLAIDYEVFIFARIREEYLRTGSTSEAIRNGLDRTAHVVTGAALIMIAVFLAFSVSSFMPIRNFGVAQAIGIFLDAFVIRLVVIPMVVEWLGRWSWWMPRWLDRLLPGGGAPPPRTAPA